ncbi:MAG: dienelactone hydrolase family protein [Gemmataceae bacterium]
MHRMLLPMLLALAAGCGGRDPVAIPEAAELKKLPPGTHQQTADIPSVGRVRYTIDIPSGYDGKTPVPLVLLLHYGYDGAKPEPYTGKGMIDAFRSGLSDLHAILVAPDALGGGWKDAPNEKSVVWLTRSAMKTYAIDGKKVVLSGFSLGGEGTWFIGSRHQDLFTGAIAVAAPVAGGDAEWKIPVYVIHSDKDQIVSYDAAKKHAEAVKAKGAKLEFKTVHGLSHYKTAAYAPQVSDAVKWLQTQWK